MRVLKIIFGLLTIGHLSFAQSVNDLAVSKNSDRIRQLQKSVDNGFADNWIFKSIEKQDIDHFKSGVVISWERHLANERIIRSYSFDMNSQLRYAHEQRFENDSLKCQGYVHFKDNFVSYISLAYVDRTTLKMNHVNDMMDYKVSHYEYEIFVNDKFSCAYRTKWINHYEDLFKDKNKGKIQLVTGADCLSLSK